MAVNSNESFLALLEKSSLLNEEQMAQARDAAAAAADLGALSRLLVDRELLTRWQAKQLLNGRSSFIFGKYKLIDLLGKGGMGNVFVAQHVTMNRRVALKVISRQFGRDKAVLERFLVEAQAIAALDHPNIVHAYNVDNEGDRYYMVMEFIDGPDLQRMVEKKGKLDFVQAADFIRQAAEGLAHAHDQKMIHCDIKPANLLVNPQGVIKILDLGLARLLGSEEAEGASGQEKILGTVDYMSPEQGMQSPELDQRADIYSLGCTFYFLLAGHPPFPKGTIPERILKHQTEEPASLLEVRPGSPRDLVAIVEKMMAKAPADRYQTAKEVAHALAEWRPARGKLMRAVALDDAEEEAAGEAAVVTESDAESTPGEGASDKKEKSGKSKSAGPAWLALLPARLREPKMMLAVGGAGVLLLVILGVVLAFSLGRGRESPKHGPKSKKTAETSVVDPKSKGKGEKAAAAASNEPPKESEDDKALGAMLGEESKTDKPAVTPASKPVEPTPAAEKPAEPKPAETKPDEQKPAETKPPERKPEQRPEQKPPPKPPEKKEPPHPLRDLALAVDLPPLDPAAGGQPVPLGAIDTPADVAWNFRLIGGDKVFRSTPKMTRELKLIPEGDAAASNAWKFQFVTTPGADQPQTVDIAKLAREGKSLRFQWTGTPDPAYANLLRLCQLEVAAGAVSQQIDLTAPKKFEPMEIKFPWPPGKGSLQTVARLDLPLDFVPDPAMLRVEVVEVSGWEGRPVELPPPTPIKTPATVALPVVNHLQQTMEKAEFHLDVTVKKQTVHAELKWREIRNKSMFMVNGKVPKEMPPLDRQVLMGKLKEAENQEKDKDKNKAQMAAANRLTIERILWYGDFFEQLHGKGRVSFRLLADVGGRQVVLARTPSLADEINSLPIMPAEDGSFVLKAEAALLRGDLKLERKDKEPPNIGNWRNGLAAWKVRFAQPGQYTVEVEATTVGQSVDFAVVAENARVEGSVPDMKEWSKYQTIPLGMLKIARGGDGVVDVRPKDPKTWKPMNIRVVRLNKL